MLHYPFTPTTLFRDNLFVWEILDVLFFPQTVWPHWGVLTITVKARCSIEVVSVAFGIFPVNFHAKWLLWNVHVHFDCAGSHKTLAAEVSSAIFPVNFNTKMALVKCSCAFRLRRLAQNAGSSAISPVNLHTKWLLLNVHVHFDCAGSHKTGVARLAYSTVPVHFHKMALVKCSCVVRLRRLAHHHHHHQHQRHHHHDHHQHLHHHQHYNTFSFYSTHTAWGPLLG